jgi:cobalt-zinc-cadmium resistance protein CzcA
MLSRIIAYSLRNKLIVIFLIFGWIGVGVYSLKNLSIGAVPDITNNQVQVITTSRNLATEEVEKFITHPIELELTNLPGVLEIRSISKFGLSVITVVFEDGMGMYLPRQLIAERLEEAQDRIPEGFGSPFMGPISTGLGEIYQYILEVDPEFQSEYSGMDLRTIQDWIVKRNLSGIEGVVEVNTWGGYLKQYEVAMDPLKLKAFNISVEEVFLSLKHQNQIAGGGYIEKSGSAYFIRAEGQVTSLEQIEQIVLGERNGTPLLIRHIAKVRFGYANRYGAITANGEGEQVLGQVMMLKNANSSATIQRVKERVEAVQKLLPPGIHIKGFLDRSELIQRTTSTITENLVLGFLIVLFVVIVLLGSWRSGLIIASVIPLSLLFAFSMMHLFSIDANLMSLGAIDFGIIIDGSVIIVEYIAFRFSTSLKPADSPTPLGQQWIDELTLKSTQKMVRSALFGQIIIIIVFLPIFTLGGVESKLFTPMALVFSFALTGTMILGFTYVPVMASMFLKPGREKSIRISGKLMKGITRFYTPILQKSLKNKKLVLGSALVIMLGTVFIFNRLGGEFIPTLDEGDFVIQPELKAGTSLSETIGLTTQMERIIASFPEVKDVVTRIGAAEIPTDPMSMEETDIIITLKPPHQWITAASKDALADSMKNALEILPGIEYEFTQPIEMRFNELITGVRADLAIKIFGEDLEKLAEIGSEVGELAKSVEGASDVTVEKTTGLPQIKITYNRTQMAMHGISIDQVNQLISAGFGGLSAGTVYEDEQRYDLVLRFAPEHRKNIESIRRLSVGLENGTQLPLSSFANIEETTGPAKISRDNTRRRIVVRVNVRNRDLESVANDIREQMDRYLDLPAGYSFTFGGQYENLKKATDRLLLVVPLALLLIFMMLYLTFGTLKEALLIFTAIPLAAVGGIWTLWLRELPFSISAGIGFVALFGIAVLNGIVLIEHFKNVDKSASSNPSDWIIEATRNRLRPVLLTASAAIMGFLPMALSTSAGAEIQRPLASVVIGGLITATLLTLIVLPVLYAMMVGFKSRKRKIPKSLTIFFLFCGVVHSGFSQSEISLEQAIEIALENNAGIQAKELQLEQREKAIKTAIDIPRTGAYISYDENNIAQNGLAINVWGVQQTFEFPSVYIQKKKSYKARYSASEAFFELQQNYLRMEVSMTYNELVYLEKRQEGYRYLDSLFSHFHHAAKRRYETGETNYLESLTAESKQKEMGVMKRQLEQQIQATYQKLYRWLQIDSLIKVDTETFEPFSIHDFDVNDHPGVRSMQWNENWSKLAWKTSKQSWWPTFELEYFQGSNWGEQSPVYRGYQAGITLPLFFGSQKAEVQKAYIQTLASQKENENYRIQVGAKYAELRQKLKGFEEAIYYYEQTGRDLGQAILKQANRSYEEGEIDVYQYILSLEQVQTLYFYYLENVFNYNSTVLKMNYLQL